MNQARFYFERVEDESGVSGLGRVAEGVQFSDGSCAVRWLTAHRSSAVYATLGDVIAIHGHGGKTRIVFTDCPNCSHEWKHHWMDNCGGCDVYLCQCNAMNALPLGTGGTENPPPTNCICTPSAP